MSRPWQAAVPDALWRVEGTPPGSKSGACLQRGSSGTWESPRSPCHMPGTGDRVTKSPGVIWGLRPDDEPVRDSTNQRKRTRYRGARAKRSAARRAGWQSERRIVPVQVGTRCPRDPRAGRRRRAARSAGQHDGRDREITNRHTTTPAECGAGRPRARSGLDDPGPPER